MIIDLKGNEVTAPTMPEARPMTEAEVEMSQLRLQQFDDGFIYKWTHHPTEEGRFVMFDVNNAPIAVFASAPVVDLVCQAVRMVFHAASISQSLPKAPGTPDILDVEVVETRPDNEDAQTDQEHAAQLASPVMES